MQTRTISLLCLLLLSVTLKAQKNDSLKQSSFKPKLHLNFMLFDLPYLKYAAQSQVNYEAGVSRFHNESKNTGTYLYSNFTSPSMAQIMGYTTSFYNSMNYGVATAWNSWIDPTKSKSNKTWNRIGKEFTAAVSFAATTKLPLAGGWAHEEFHRNIWAQHNIGSYNEIWDFNLAPDALSYVSHVRDEDLAWLKVNKSKDYIRMGSAGIEAHFLTNEELQRQDFNTNTNLPNLALYWADVIAPLDYVNRATKELTNEEHAELYDKETDILKRDFIGNDFTAWVYDLFRPDELYEDRGRHPTGIGVDRYRTHEDLTNEMLSYVEKMGNRQYLNFISPFMIGIRSIKYNEQFRFNFALRHYLTSFGDDTQLEVFYDFNNNLGQVVLHLYSNYESSFPGIENNINLSSFIIGKSSKISLHNRTIIWLQPENQKFKTNKSTLGGLTSISAQFDSKSKVKPYLQLEAKTKGWVAGNPYLNDNFSCRFGFMADF